VFDDIIHKKERLMKCLANLLAITLVVLGVGEVHVSAAQLYWTDTLGEPGVPPRADNIQRADIGGANLAIVVGGLGNPQDVAVDLVNGKVYWTDDLDDNIQRADLNGSNVQELVAGVNGPKGITLDINGGKMYWADNFTSKIQRANLDGSTVQDVFQFTSGSHALSGVDLDVSAGKVYWTDSATGVSGSILRRNMDGTGLTETVLTSTNHGPNWIARDTQTGDLFWSSEVTNTVLRNNSIIATGINNVRDIALDVVGRKIFWTSLSDDKIIGANLNGNGQVDAVTGLGNPHGLAFVPEPSTLTLAVFGLLGLFVHSRRTRNR
jgi:glucose/arabinose dehydrogenase